VRIRFRTLRTEAIHHECGVAGGTLSPLPQLMPKVRRRCLRRDVDGPIHQSHVAEAGAWKESEWLEIQEA
jgi:hypothetical protein